MSGLTCVTATKIATRPRARHSTARTRSLGRPQRQTGLPLGPRGPRRRKRIGLGRATLPAFGRAPSHTSRPRITSPALTVRSHTPLQQSSPPAPGRTALMAMCAKMGHMADPVRGAAPSIQEAYRSDRQCRPMSTPTASSHRCQHSRVSTASIALYLSPSTMLPSRISPPSPSRRPISPRQPLTSESSNTCQLRRVTTRTVANSQPKT